MYNYWPTMPGKPINYWLRFYKPINHYKFAEASLKVHCNYYFADKIPYQLSLKLIFRGRVNQLKVFIVSQSKVTMVKGKRVIQYVIQILTCHLHYIIYFNRTSSVLCEGVQYKVCDIGYELKV